MSNPSFVKEYRSIVCCYTMYKLLAIIITSRLKLVIDYLVGLSHSAFRDGNNILLDNVIVAHELVKGYTKKECLIKVNIRKAYDSVE